MNNLTQREKTMIYIVLATGPLVLLYFGFSFFMSSYKERQSEYQNRKAKLDQIKMRIQEATYKSALRNDYEQRSLPADENVAISEYRDWLQDLAENEIKFGGPPTVSPKATVPFKSEFGKKDVLYSQLNFQFDGTGSYKQIVDFLYRFYEKNYLHRIERLDLNLARTKVKGKMTYDRKLFTVKAHIQVLSLKTAGEKRNPTAVANARLFYDAKDKESHIRELEDYYQLVLRRNLFGMPNNAPDFGSRKKDFEFEEGDRVSIRLRADDEDEDELEYELVSTDNKVKSDMIEKSREGSFRLNIEEIGEYRFKAKVTDKSYYPKSDEMDVVVIVEKKKVVTRPVKNEDPPPRPKFNPLRYTTLEAIVQGVDGKPVCLIYVRPLDQMHKVAQGEKFQIGESKGEVISISKRNAVIEIDGEQFLFEVNDFLGNPRGDSIQNPRTQASEESKKETAKPVELAAKDDE